MDIAIEFIGWIIFTFLMIVLANTLPEYLYIPIFILLAVLGSFISYKIWKQEKKH